MSKYEFYLKKNIYFIDEVFERLGVDITKLIENWAAYTILVAI